MYNRGEQKLPSRAVFNFNLRYHFTEAVVGFLTLRDLATNRDREYIGGDLVEPTILIGVEFRR